MPRRLLLSIISTVFFVLCLLYLGLSSDDDELPKQPQAPSTPGSRLSYNGPSSLFSPSATISLTEDNSTFFAARPASFGPSLPDFGLSGQIWIGSGFGESHIRRRGIAASFEGELGCSDIPGWSQEELYDDDRASTVEGDLYTRVMNAKERSDAISRKEDRQLKRTSSLDRTDNYLHRPLTSTSVVRTSRIASQEHADIQSLQEGVEITGKIVLLSRGGCGFLEKIMWAQRRGATAVIVGDNLRGGPLIRMYAQDDTSNITIPSLFTSHTTAHLLSSLVPLGYNFDTASATRNRVSRPKAGSTQKLKTKATSPFKHTAQVLKDANLLKSSPKKTIPILRFEDERDPNIKHSTLRTSSLKETNQREYAGMRAALSRLVSSESAGGKEDRPDTKNGDQPHEDFVIGVHDWRDPDISVPRQKYQSNSRFQSHVRSSGVEKPSHADNHLQGGHITPSSGVYEPSQDQYARSYADKISATLPSSHSAGTPRGSRSWLSALFWAGDGEELSKSSHDDNEFMKPLDMPGSRLKNEVNDFDSGEYDMHNGLWVTLTPTSMDPSPLLNTLFVLVISPLVTLGIVYTLLIIRARIRRRRWRAPKSLVDRLPVRIFSTLQRTSSTTSEESQGDQGTSSTPLLAGSRATDIGQRPRPATVSGVSGSMGSSYRYGSLEPSTAEQEKINNGLAEWRRRYVGRQIECAVCLEEYVDGVSHVMSLPCGHEFHVDCITPWLTTRRRTCPICKGDVVRSMIGGPPLSDDEGTEDSSEESIQQEAAETVNSSPSAALPVPTQQEFSFDLESGHHREATPANAQQSSWLTALMSPGRRNGANHSVVASESNNAPATLDRDR